jgi:tripartite-type tricarboxylate transporter receptor subunit TctC
MYSKVVRGMSASLFLLFTLGGVTPGFASQFYEGKTVRIIVPSSPGGGTDMLARLLARHMGKHVPGNPIFVVQNVTGAGQLVGTAYAYKAKPDGLTIGTYDGGNLIGYAAGVAKDKFNLAKAEYIGNPFADDRVLFVRSATGIKELSQVHGSSKSLNLGASNRADSKADMIYALKTLGGYNLNLIFGYRGTSTITAAILRNELDGSVIGWTNLKSLYPDWIKKNYVNILVQTGKKREPDLSDVPLISEVVPAKWKRVVNTLSVPFSIAKPFFFPPGTPPERLEIMRKAFEATMKDPAFLADAARLRRPITPTSGTELQETVEDVLNQPPEVVEELKKITGVSS